MKSMIAFVIVGLSYSSLIGAAEPDIVIADFEGQDYGEWTVTGEAFGSGPARGTLPQQQRVSGFEGKGLVNTFFGQDRTTGTLTSPELAIQRKYINFLIGGGRYPGKTCMNLLVDGKVVRTATGPNGAPGGSERLQLCTWDVSEFAGKRTRIQIVDQATGGWGHVNVDQIVQSNTARGRRIPGDPRAEQLAARAKLRKCGVEDIVFAVRQMDRDGHWYANFGYWSNNPERKLYHDGGRLCRLNVATGKVTALLDDPKGGVRDPQMHYDGRKILFSYRKGGQPYYHLYEINVDGSGLRQLTHGPYDDYEPTYLPDGGIIFCSSRCKRMVNCYYVPVAVLYRCDGDGSKIQQLSANLEQDNTPRVLPDGRILYMRWEYIDRSQVGYHHLWTMNPDGTGQMVYFGNQRPSTVMIDAKPIPGTDKVVASFSPGHGRREHAGVITVVDPDRGPDVDASARSISRGQLYRDPYPLSEECFLVAGETDGIYVMDADGQCNLLFDLSAADKQAGLFVHEPRPILSRPRERVISKQTNRAQTTGRVILGNVYQGRNMAGIKPGDIKKLLVLEALPKPVNFSGGWEPLSFGGTFTLERILGTVPVEKDGSAYIELPALRSLFLVALDKNDMAVKRMQSFLTVQPDETFSCVGCHEQRTQTMLPVSTLTALRRPASKIETIADVPDVFDFPRDIQPILDKHCVACHDYDATTAGGPRDGDVILSGDRGPFYSHSYVSLTIRGQFTDGRNLLKSNYGPREIGSSSSPLLEKLDGDHYEAKLSEHEKRMVRLWIDTAAAYPGTYAALLSGMVGGERWGPNAKAVVGRRCAECHTGAKQLPQSPGDSLGLGTTGSVRPDDPKLRFSNHVVYNLTRPEKSLLLLAPLAKEAGGYGICGAKVKESTEKTAAVFTDTNDPDYRLLLAAIGETKKQLETVKRFDMSGFRPNKHYIREMKRYGILPETLGDDDPIDVYQTDQAYWKSLWHRPAAK